MVTTPGSIETDGKKCPVCDSPLKGEIEISMRLLGVKRVDQLGPEYLNCERL